MKSAVADRAARVDPVTLEVLRAGLTSIVHEMSVTLTRTAYSTIIRDVHDFSCVIFDRRGRLIAQAEGIPSFNGSMSFALEATTAKFPLAAMRPGDVYVSNDPYFGEGASFHKNDINILMPIFLDDELVMVSASKAHYLDIGGKDPGSYSPDAQNAFQEGLTLPPVKLYAEKQLNEAVMDIFLANVRVPNLERGDLAAQLAAGSTAEGRSLDLLRRYGRDTLEAAVDELLDHAERMVRSAIERIPDGVYVAEGFHDGDGTSEEPIPIRVEVTVADSEITIDTTGSADQRRSSSGNCHWLTTVAASRETVMFLAETSAGTNEGSYRPINVISPPGSVYHPLPPAPTTTGTADMSVRLIELILQALAPVLPQDVIAGTFGTVSALALAGADPDSGNEFVHFSPYAGGWGGRAHADGNSAMVSLLSGDNYNIPCEVMETRFPGLLADSYRLRNGSAGAGRHRGGWGVAYDYRSLVPVEVAVALDHYAFPPHGLFGGGSGSPSALVINPAQDDERVLHQAAGITLPEGTVISHRTAGGGGYGEPTERDPEAVALDVQNEFITVDDASSDYAVVLDPTSLVVDRRATADARLARLLSELRDGLAVSRATLRLDIPGSEKMPMTHEALAPGISSVRGKVVPAMSSPTVKRMLESRDWVVVPDCARQPEIDPLFDDPSYTTMVKTYALAAYIAAPIWDGERIAGILSLHETVGARAWSEEDLDAVRRALERIAALTGDLLEGTR